MSRPIIEHHFDRGAREALVAGAAFREAREALVAFLSDLRLGGRSTDKKLAYLAGRAAGAAGATRLEAEGEE